MLQLINFALDVKRTNSSFLFYIEVLAEYCDLFDFKVYSMITLTGVVLS